MPGAWLLWEKKEPVTRITAENGSCFWGAINVVIFYLGSGHMLMQLKFLSPYICYLNTFLCMLYFNKMRNQQKVSAKAQKCESTTLLE